MRRVLLFIISCFFVCALKSQTYANEWINFSQKYFKFPIAKEGLYRLDSTTLSKYYDLSITDPRNFQLFLKGKEQFLFIPGEADGKINQSDFIEFYANPYMGDIDSLVYTNIKYLPNPYLPLFNDTIYAFLTLNPSLNNKRFTQESDVNFSAYTPSDYFYTEKVFSAKGTYNSVTEIMGSSSDAHLTQAEGYGAYVFRNAVGPGTAYTYPVSNLNTYTNTALPFYISTNYSGQSQAAAYSPDHHVQLFYSNNNNTPTLLSDTSFYGFKPVRKTFVINSQNTNNNTAVTFSSVTDPSFTNNGTENWHYLHYFYPHTTDLNYQPLVKLWLEDHPSSNKTYFDFSNFGVGTSSTVIAYDITNGKRISTAINFSQVKVLIPNSGGKKICLLFSEKDTLVVKKLIPVNQTGFFTDYKNKPANKAYALIYHKNFEASAIAYKNYRKDINGGGFDVIDAEIESLYEQFSYGVRKHPLAIRNYVKFLKDSLANAPKYVLLIGKAIGFGDLIGANAAVQGQNMIPTFGIPPSDNLLTASLSSTNTNAYYPEIPIGRLAVLSNTEVTSYLDKIKKHEEPAPLIDWKKQVLHFVGGNDEQTLNEISTYMSGFETIISDTLFGGNVATVKKNTTAPVQNNISDSLRNVINRGAALINFFGHGSTSGFDQAVDDPEMYNNKDKYPFVVANSCYSGNLHTSLRSVSERFVITKEKGSIGFLATTSYGYAWNLNNFTSAFYKGLANTHYNQGVGDIIKQSILQNSLGGEMDRLTGIDMTLSGDPAVKISNGFLPDYQIFTNDVAFDLKKYTDSVGIRFSYKNLGIAVRDTFSIRIERFFPNGDSTTIIKYVKRLLYKDSLSLYFPIDFNRGIGLNKFRIKLDNYEKVNEISETNNTIGPLDFFIPGGDILPAYPYKYAIIPKTTTLTLKASTTDPFAPSTTYRFQLDTCDRFTSLISSTLITSAGGVIEWKVNLPYGDSTVYFWRVSRDSISAQKPFAWRESSFQTIGDKHGWSQAQFHQFKNNAYQFVNYKKEERRFVFENNKHSILCRTGVHPYFDLSLMNYFFDTFLTEGWSSTFNGWNFAVFDSITGQPQETKSLNYPATGLGPFNNCVEYGSRFVYSFGATPKCGFQASWKTDMENFLNSIPANQYVLAYTTGYTGPDYTETESYSNPLYNAFDNIGAKDIRTLDDSIPYILFGRKGMSAGQAHVVKGLNKRSHLILEDSIKTRWNTGYIASEIIGPSLKWNSLHWRVKSLENISGDSTLLKVVGIKSNGQTDTLASFREDSLDITALSSYANASVYPYLKLIAFMKDNVSRTSPQLERWQVLYDEAPECAINPLKGFASINDTLLEGDEVTFRFPIENIGISNFNDSLLVTYWIENNQLAKIPLPHKLKTAPFAAGQVLIDTVRINSYQLKGNNALWIYVNPLNAPHYQHEQSQFNNIGRYAFKVNKDVTNPLLDVTFDGVRILNGDIVSSQPNILITLKDENKFLALNDTSAFTIYLMSPQQSQQQRIYFGQQLQFTPASLPKNSCSINYNPNFITDGKYTLIVQARDRSSNASAARDYRIEFEIYTKPSVTNVLNYPNPFSTNTKFVFTLTGSEIPEVFTIQIMTITGKIVREITRSELGSLHIGRNITDYGWDGRDNYGDRLANGVYLYRVITKLNGQNVEKNSTGADKFFTKDFGKMVLIR